MNVIYLKAFRDLWRMKGRALAIALILSFGVTAYIGFYASVESLFHTRDSYYRELGAADLEVLFAPRSPGDIPDISGIPGVAGVESRMVAMGNIQLDGKRRLPALLILSDGKRPNPITRLKIIEGRLPGPDDPEGVVVERSLARYHGYKVGDTIRANIGDISVKGKIRGVAVSSEFLSSTANPDYFVPQKGSLGVIFADLSRMKQFVIEVAVNDMIVEYAKGADAAAIRGRIVDRLDDALTLLKVTSREEQFGHQYLEKDLGAFKLFVPAVIAVFALTSFLITLITFNRMILSQRKEIGTLLAIGYTPGRIFSTYLIGGMAIGIVGSFLGYPFSFVVRNLFGWEYGIAVGLPEVIFVTPWPLVVKGMAMGVGIALAAAAWPAYKVVRMTPQEAIRAPQGAGWRTGRRLQQALVKRLPSSIHAGYGLRNLLRHKGLTASTVVCIALAIGVAISYVVSMSSVRYTVDRYFQRDKWDLAVDLLSSVSSEHLRMVNDIAGVGMVVPTLKGEVRIFKGDRRLDCRLVGLPHDSPVNRLNLIAGRAYRGGGAMEIVLDKEDAKVIGAQVGDSIRIVSGEQKKEATLVGLVTGLMSGQAYGGLEMSRGLLGMENLTNGLFLSLAPGAEEKETLDRLYALDFVGRVTSKTAVVDDFMALTSEIMGIVYLCSAFAIITGVLFIFTGITLNILERESEYATLQTLGFGRRNLAGMVLSEAMVQGLLALILSIPAGVLISRFLTGRMSAAWFAIDSHFTAAQFLWILAPAFLVMPLATIPGLRSIFRINIAEAVRRRVMD